ncbi:MAG: GNAT family N-acetyltransferase [Clostridiales bacterium]|nr:GNAT family N-acetyltransferase [Clostridiales bacterium]
MELKKIISSDDLWDSVRTYAENCSCRAGKLLAEAMKQNMFKDWERLIVALEQGNICGYCAVVKKDCIPNVPYTPYISYLFVGEEYRGNKLSQRLIQYAMGYLRSLGFETVYLVSDHENLYEKYGFYVIDRKLAPWGSEEKIYMQKL